MSSRTERKIGRSLTNTVKTYAIKWDYFNILRVANSQDGKKLKASFSPFSIACPLAEQRSKAWVLWPVRSASSWLILCGGSPCFTRVLPMGCHPFPSWSRMGFSQAAALQIVLQHSSILQGYISGTASEQVPHGQQHSQMTCCIGAPPQLQVEICSAKCPWVAGGQPAPSWASPGLQELLLCTWSTSCPHSALTLVGAGCFSHVSSLLSQWLSCSSFSFLPSALTEEQSAPLLSVSSLAAASPRWSSWSWIWSDMAQILGSAYKGHPCSPFAP